MGRHIVSYTQVVALLKPVFVQDAQPGLGFDPTLNYRDLADRWMEHFSRYIQGSGHPEFDSTSNENEQENDYLRARWFFKSVTAQDYLPIDPDSTIKVSGFGVTVSICLPISHDSDQICHGTVG